MGETISSIHNWMSIVLIEVFPNAAFVVTLVDRLVHRSEILHIQGDSFRLKESKERQAERSRAQG